MAKANHTSIDTMFSDVENPGLYFQMKKKNFSVVLDKTYQHK